MSVLLLTSLVFGFAPPPPPPSGDDTQTPAEPEDEPEDTSDPTSERTPSPNPNPEVPLDDRYDPILPYGDTPDQPELEYAEETPPPPEIEFADETPPPPDIEYDQSHQRPSPAADALARESDEQNDLGEPEFNGLVESPQRFAIEVKFGPYLPDVDRRWNGAGLGPYASIYGPTDDTGAATKQPRKGLFSVLSFEWQFVHIGGPLSVGTTVGLFRDKADALVVIPVAGESLRSSADKTRFNVVPVTVLLGYRFELLADRFKVPLVPYARGGVAYGFWWERKGDKLATNSAGQKARGGSWGWQVNLGLMLRLDFIERGTAVDLDRLTGINHTYVFGEWQFSHLDGFGSDAAMSIGDDTFLVGLAFEF